MKENEAKAKGWWRKQPILVRLVIGLIIFPLFLIGFGLWFIGMILYIPAMLFDLLTLE
jgi:hypothetical protein